jgi:hypothetical protein
MHRLLLLALLASIACGSSSALAQEAPAPTDAISAPPAVDVTASTTVSATLDASTWSPSDPAPPGYHTEQKSTRAGFVTAGLTMFGVGYGLSAGTGAPAAMVISSANGSDSDEWGCTPHCSLAPTIPFFVPVAGPFILAAEAGGSASGAMAMIAIGDGLVQAGGIAMLAYGLTAPEKTLLVRDRSARTRSFTLSPAPIVGNGREGMALVGTF